jgi:hypothetical protein
MSTLKFNYDAERGLLTLEASEEEAKLILRAQDLYKERERGEAYFRRPWWADKGPAVAVFRAAEVLIGIPSEPLTDEQQEKLTRLKELARSLGCVVGQICRETDCDPSWIVFDADRRAPFAPEFFDLAAVEEYLTDRAAYLTDRAAENRPDQQN